MSVSPEEPAPAQRWFLLATEDLGAAQVLVDDGTASHPTGPQIDLAGCVEGMAEQPPQGHAECIGDEASGERDP